MSMFGVRKVRLVSSLTLNLGAIIARVYAPGAASLRLPLIAAALSITASSS